MDDASSSYFRAIHDARRAFVERFPVIPAAYSLDGQTFAFHAPVGVDFEAGTYVRLDIHPGLSLIGQIFEAGIEQLESSEVAIDNTHAQGITVPGLSFGGAKIQMRRHGLQGNGTILGALAGGDTSEVGPFDDVEIRVATIDDIKAYFAASSAKRPTMTIGTIPVPGGMLPGEIDPAGFNRHTFLCGQSGSGKTYSLGVVLEQLLLRTDLRVVMLDPNADFVRMRHTLDAVTTSDEGARYAERVRDMAVYRSGELAEDERPLRIRFSDLRLSDQARALQLDPLADREEFHAFRQAVQGFGDRHFDLADVQRVSSETLSTAARDVTLRIANLGVEDWDVWARSGDSSLADLLEEAWRSVVLDVSRFANPIERSVVALGMLRHFWAQRESRTPVLIVIDEAHNICPALPDDAIQKAVVDLLGTIAAEGRKYGIYLLVSTQRPDKIHPSILSQCDNLMLMRMNSQADLNDLATVFSFVPQGMLAKAATFRQGEALFAGRIVPVPRLVRMGRRLSTEGGADVPTTWVHADTANGSDASA